MPRRPLQELVDEYIAGMSRSLDTEIARRLADSATPRMFVHPVDADGRGIAAWIPTDPPRFTLPTQEERDAIILRYGGTPPREYSRVPLPQTIRGDDGIEMRMRMYANHIHTGWNATFPVDPEPAPQAPLEALAQLSNAYTVTAIDREAGTITAERADGFEIRTGADVNNFAIGMTLNCSGPGLDEEMPRMTAAQHHEEFQKALDREQDALRAGARGFDRTDFVQKLGEARQTLEELNESTRLAINEPLSSAFRPLRLERRQHTSDYIPIHVKQILAIELALARVEMKYHDAMRELELLRGRP